VMQLSAEPLAVTDARRGRYLFLDGP